MPSRTSATFAKRQKEQARREKQQAKFQRKQQRKLEKRDPLPDSESGSPGSTTDTDSSFEPLSATNMAAAGTATTEKEIQ